MSVIMKFQVSDVLSMLKTLPETFYQNDPLITFAPTEDGLNLLTWVEVPSQVNTSTALIQASREVPGTIMYCTLSMPVASLKTWLQQIPNDATVQCIYNVKDHTPIALNECLSKTVGFFDMLVEYTAGDLTGSKSMTCALNINTRPDGQNLRDTIKGMTCLDPDNTVYLHDNGLLILFHDHDWSIVTELPYIKPETIEQLLEQLGLPVLNHLNSIIQNFINKGTANMTEDTTFPTTTEEVCIENVTIDALPPPPSEIKVDTEATVQKRRGRKPKKETEEMTDTITTIVEDVAKPVEELSTTATMEEAKAKRERATPEEVDQRAIDRLTTRGYVVTKIEPPTEKTLTDRVMSAIEQTQDTLGLLKELAKEVKSLQKAELDLDHMSAQDLVSLSLKINKVIAGHLMK